MAGEEVKSTIRMVYVADVIEAIANTQKLADAQERQAKRASKAMDDFSKDAMSALKKVDDSIKADQKAIDAFAKDATRALGQVERSVAAQEKAWAKTIRQMEEGGGVFGKVKSGLDGFNSTVGLVTRSLGTAGAAIELGTTAVSLLGKAWGSVASEFNKPQLRMLWEKDAFKEWMARFKEMEAESDRWAAKMQVTFFGADVDSDRNVARRHRARAEVVRKEQEEAGWVDYQREQQLERQKAEIQDRKDRFNHEGKYAPKKRTGGGGYELKNAVELDGTQWISIDTVETMIEEIVAARTGGLTFGGMGAELLDSIGGSAKKIDTGYAAQSGIGSTGGFGDFSADSLAKQPSILERMLGPVEQFDAYATAWGTFTDAATAGYTALITGSESAGAAMKRIIGQSIMAEGSRMLVMALREGAEAIASLASGNVAKAGTHALAAAKFGAGAAIAGVVASSLGVGGSTAAASGGYGASASGIGLGGGDSQIPASNRTIIIGDSFGFESPRDQARHFASRIRRTRLYERDPEARYE